LVDPVGLLFFHGAVALWDDSFLGLAALPDPPPSDPGSDPVECETTLLARGQGDETKLLCVRPHPLSCRHLCALWSGGRLDIYCTEATPFSRR